LNTRKTSYRYISRISKTSFREIHSLFVHLYFTIGGTRFSHKTSFVAKYHEQEVYIPQYVLTILSKAAYV